MLPQRCALVRVHPRHEQRPRGALAEPGGEQRRAADLFGDDVFHLVGVEDEQVGSGRFGISIRNPHDDAVVTRHRRSLDAETFADARIDGQRPRRVHFHAVRGMQDDAPVADFIAAALDREISVGRQGAGGFALLSQMREQVGARLLIEPGLDEALRGLLRRRSIHLAGERAERFAELIRPADAIAMPERHLARLPVRGDHVHAVVGDLGELASSSCRG